MLNFVLCNSNMNFLDRLNTTLNSLILKNDFDANIGFKSTKTSEILNYVVSNKTDVLFLDINLNSSINGIELAEKIRKTNKDMYFIFVTRAFRICFFSFSG